MLTPTRTATMLLLMTSACLKAQDSIHANKLDEVVITGQHNPQSVKKSVFEVKVISRDDIDRQAGNNLADLLNTTLNINILPNASTGKSGVQLFGLDAQYFKILVDNIPVINDEGLGNNTDLTQIDLDDIQRIEIVEGSMGVEYGANAVSGIINIITKKSSRYKWEITPYVQEETIGGEYNPVDRGRHIQSLNIGHNFNEKWYVDGMFTANDFTGYRNGRKGEHWPENDGLRGFEWLPKLQLNAKALASYKTGAHHFFYKFEFFRETTKRYNPEVRPNYNPATETTDPTATDDIFTSTRFFHHLNGSGQFRSGLAYDASVSYQRQTRGIETYNYRILADERFDVQEFEYESREGFYSKGSLSNFLEPDFIDFQLGYELSEIKGFASDIAGTFAEPVSRALGSYDIFASAEINFTDAFSLRPGARLLASSQFDPQAAISLSARYLLKNDWELRGIVGTSPRLPDYEELYSYFVDVNHDVRGNENLAPEQGGSVFLHVNKKIKSKGETRWQLKWSGWFLDVRDRIELIVVNDSPLSYQFRNIDQYRSAGTSLTASFAGKNTTLGAGLTYGGISKVLDSRENHNDDFLFAFQANSNVSYHFKKARTIVSAYLKYNGPVYQFVEKTGDGNESMIVRGRQEGFAWLDATVKKTLGERLEITAGMRNIANVRRVDTTATEGGAHDGPATSLLLGYGRSGFLKVLYRFNI
jgi:outer membrane receptor for ferrienterochelin and colicins